MIGRHRTSRARILVVPAAGLALFLAACATNSIESSPFRAQFNAALDSCEGASHEDQREDCYDQAMQEYTAKYEEWVASKKKK